MLIYCHMKHDLLNIFQIHLHNLFYLGDILSEKSSVVLQLPLNLYKIVTKDG